jgi:hypothetical protein
MRGMAFETVEFAVVDLEMKSVESASDMLAGTRLAPTHLPKIVRIPWLVIATSVTAIS